MDICSTVWSTCGLQLKYSGAYMCSVADTFAQTYATNVKCMNISVPGHTVDYIGFICGKYADLASHIYA